LRWSNVYSNNFDVAGNVICGPLGCSTLAASGNATLSGTLAVTGASTFAAVSCASLLPVTNNVSSLGGGGQNFNFLYCNSIVLTNIYATYRLLLAGAGTSGEGLGADGTGMLFDSRAGYSFRTGNNSATLLVTLTSANGLTPGATATYNLGTTALRWNGLNCATVNASGASTLTGAVTCGSTLAVTGAATLSGGLAVTGTSTLNGNVLPLTNLVGDLGNSSAY
jgi:hypothetical protein